MRLQEIDTRLDFQDFGTKVYKAGFPAQPAGLLMTEGSSVRTTRKLPAPKALGRILLVDDDFAIQEGVAEFLECEGFSVVSASNGLDALNQLRSGLRVDAIVLDVMMPMMDGWDFRAQQLADGTLCLIPVVIITAAGFAGDTIREQFNVGDVFSKPLDLPHFVRAVREVCKCSDPGQTPSAAGT